MWDLRKTISIRSTLICENGMENKEFKIVRIAQSGGKKLDEKGCTV